MLDSFSLATHQGDHDPLKALPFALLTVTLDITELTALGFPRSAMASMRDSKTVGEGLQMLRKTPQAFSDAVKWLGSKFRPVPKTGTPTPAPTAPAPATKPVPTPGPNTAGNAGNATTNVRQPLAGPTKNWETFTKAEKQIQLEAASVKRADQVINETLSGRKNFTSNLTLTTDEALSAGQKYLGPGYKEIGKPGSGVFHSADGRREFRIDIGSLSGSHPPGVPHVHFGLKDPATGKYISNNHVPYRR